MDIVQVIAVIRPIIKEGGETECRLYCPPIIAERKPEVATPPSGMIVATLCAQAEDLCINLPTNSHATRAKTRATLLRVDKSGVGASPGGGGC